MAGTQAGGAKAAATNKKHYGADFYVRIGRIGGSSSGHTLNDVLNGAAPKGFAANREHARKAGAKGGLVSRRGKARSKQEEQQVERIKQRFNIQ